MNSRTVRETTQADSQICRPRTLILATTACLFLSVAETQAQRGGSAAGPTIVQPQARMGEPLPGLTPGQLTRFHKGQVLYNTNLTAENGLGPIFNKASCGNCHNVPLGGTGSQIVTRFGREEKGVFDPLEHLGGSLLQISAISPECEEVIPPEANVIAPRVTNGALAYGLVEAIPDAALLAVRDAQPLAVRGQAHMVGAFEDPPGSPLRVGRFGWKSQVATVLTFSADASLNEMGLTNRFLQEENAPNGDLKRLELCDNVRDPEDGPDAEGFDFIDRVTDFQRFLAPFPQTPKSGMTGEGLFMEIGCGVCHHPSYTTADDPNLEAAIRNKVIRPYSDFLLHNMGLTSDPIVLGDAEQLMVKTPPLWGILVRDPIWHDGRVGGGDFEYRMREVIELHRAFGSQAKPSGDEFVNRTAAEQAAIIAFLASLGQPEFEANGDHEITVIDFIEPMRGFRACYTGPGSFYTPDHACSIHDIDQDGDVDLDDFASFLQVYIGMRRDCNNNGVIDLQDILTGVLSDANNNGIPDSCEPTCDADVSGDGLVNVNDLLAVINQWGPCPAPQLPCGADINFDHVVNVNDLLAVINSWGPCP